MGTRNVTYVQLDGEYKVAQYCQWDGYPTGQGKTIVDFLENVMDREIFEKKLRALVHITDKQVEKKLKEEFNVAFGSNGIPVKIYDKFSERYPQLSIDTGADILKIIQEKPEGLEIVLDLEFANNSLYCEWAYVIDLDKDQFEIYTGFNKVPLPEGERFKSKSANSDGYYPVKLVATYPLGNLPTEQHLETLERKVWEKINYLMKPWSFSNLQQNI